MALPFEWRKNPIFLGVELAKETIRQVAAGHRTIGLFGGGASIGKTYLTRQICRQHRIKEVPEDRPDNAEALVSMTWRHREHPVHVLNECDHILRGERAMNVLKLMHEEPRKCALYTKESRRNEEYLEVGSRQYRESIPPTSFELDNLCRHILTSNLNYQSEEVTCQLPKDHWLALLRRGIDPVYVEIGGNDGLDLFQYTVGLATEGQMLRSHQVDYATARDAVAFYVQNANRLVDITPARLMMIATAIRDAGADKSRRDQRLGLMLRQTDQRPRLQLDQHMVQALLWPRRPPKRKKRQPETPKASVVDAPKPEPAIVRPVLLLPPPTPPDPPPELSCAEAIRAIYGLPSDEQTCDAVAGLLDRLPLAEYDDDEMHCLAERLEGCSMWQDENIQSLAHVFVQYADGPLLFCTGDEVLVWEGSEKGLQIYRWYAVRTMMAPHIEEEARRRDAQLRRRDTQALLATKLPPKRKLKAVKERINQIIELGAAKFSENVQRATDHIRQMIADDPRFADCMTLERYINAVAESLDLSSDPPSEGE
jgi:hypothetical protein